MSSSALASITSVPPVTATTDPRFLGFWNNQGEWTMIGCTYSKEYYQESSTYFGCSTLYTGCTEASQPANSRTGIQYCTGNRICTTQTLHAKSPAPSFDPSRKIKPLCVSTNYNVIDLYRVSPTPPSSSSLQPSSMTASSRASSSLPPSPTSSGTASSQTAAPPDSSPQSVSPGVIAGATIAGIALLLVLAFLIWFFGFHRRNQKREQQQAMSYQHSPAWNQQSEFVQPSYEVDGAHGHGSAGGYAPVQQHPPDTWKYGHASQASELATEPHGRRS